MKEPRSTLGYVLTALLPYSKANMQLAFKPGKFFSELERISQANRNTLQSTLGRAQKQGLVKRSEGVPMLTAKGYEKVQLYAPKTLRKSVYLMVIFDIPENQAAKRQVLRLYLKQLSFEQVQKSVWATKYDYRVQIKDAVKKLQLKHSILMYEAALLDN